MLTNVLLEGDQEDAEWFEEAVQLAGDRNASLLPVRLTITPEELARRVASVGRAEQFKEIDPVSAMEKARRFDLLRPRVQNTLNLDVTAMSASLAAEKIISRLQELLNGT